MLKLILKLCVLFSTFGYLNAASFPANVQFSTCCTVQIFTFTAKAQASFVKSAGSTLFSKSQWVSSSMTTMNENVLRFIAAVASLNVEYSTGNQYYASTQMRDQIATIMEIVNTAGSIATAAQVSNANALAAECSAVVQLAQGVRQFLLQYTQFNLFTSFYNFIAVVFPDDQLSTLQSVVVRSASVINNIMNAVSNRVINDTNFLSLVFSLDFQMAINNGNTAATNVALSAQRAYYDTGVETSTFGAFETLDAQQAILDAYTISIILEFNVFGAYAQTAVDTLTDAVISFLVSPTTLQTVYNPLAQQLLTGLANAYIAVNGEFLLAIQDCKQQIESSTPGDNDSQGPNESNYASGENSMYSMKGEVKKCENRGRFLLTAIQNQYKKSGWAAICGGVSINEIMVRVIGHQARVANCGVGLIYNFRLVLSQVEQIIREEIDKNLKAFLACAKQATGTANSGEVSQTCTGSNVDVNFNNLINRAFPLVDQLRMGGTYINQANTCRMNVGSSLATFLGQIKGSFRSCSGVPQF